MGAGGQRSVPGRPTKARGDELLDHARAAADATHPALALAEIQRGELSPAEVLERLEGVEAVIEADSLGLTTAVGQRLIEGELSSPTVRLGAPSRTDRQRGASGTRVAAIWRLQRAHVAMLDHREVDHDDLLAAESAFLALREDMQRRGRQGDSGAMLTRAIDVCLLAKRLDRAAELTGSGDRRRSGAGQLASDWLRQAVLCGQGELSSSSHGRGSERVRAGHRGLVNIDSTRRRHASRRWVFDELLFSEDEDIWQRRPWRARSLLWARKDPAEWSERAEEVLAERDPTAACRFFARGASRAGEFEDAEAVLRRHTENPRR